MINRFLLFHPIQYEPHLPLKPLLVFQLVLIILIILRYLKVLKSLKLLKVLQLFRHIIHLMEHAIILKEEILKVANLVKTIFLLISPLLFTIKQVILALFLLF